MRAVAIDGPAGAGKSTIARKVAAELGYIYVDTGALYRTVGYFAANRGVNTSSGAEVVPLLSEASLEIRFQNGLQRVYLNGEDVSEKIRTPEMSLHASRVSAIPAVREFLFALQTEIASKNNVVMDGRDIGTEVLPGADVKIFLTATPEDRAMRRYQEHQFRGESIDFDTLLREVKERDYADSHREFRPLRQAEDAILLDTTGNTLEESLKLVLDTVRARLS